MTYWADPYVQLYIGNCREVLTQLPAESVDCVVTSPPYWGLRKYEGNQDLIWGGREDCQHQWGQATLAPIHPKDRRCVRCKKFGVTVWETATKTVTNCAQCGYRTEREGVESFGRRSIRGPKGDIVRQHKNMEKVGDTNFCSLCGCWRGAFGLEPDLGIYIAHSVEIMRQVRRVLKKTGVVWWNIGDSYASAAQGEGKGAPTWQRAMRKKEVPSGLKPKDLCLIPFRLAIALQEDGWWVRSVIIWAKNNPMPESVTDRPTDAHDYILMLTKSARYFYDADAVREPHQEVSIARAQRRWAVDTKYQNKNSPDAPSWVRAWMEGKDTDMLRTLHPMGANMRSVWTFSTQSYEGAHFATFPEELPKRCILASTSEKGNCSKCGKPWVRITKTTGSNYARRKELGIGGPYNLKPELMRQGAKEGALGSKHQTLGWQPQCQCGEEPIPAVVLDPFVGSGTTCAVAKSLGRKSIGIDISEDYLKLTTKRVTEVPLPMRL